MITRQAEWRREAQAIEHVLAGAPTFDKNLHIPRSEFQTRAKRVAEALAEAGLDCGLVYSDEHYAGDVPYLGGNTNISIEPVAGVVGRHGFHLLAGLEGGYVAEQLAPRAGVTVHKVEMLKLADEDYPIAAERLEDVLVEACGSRPKRIGLLTPRAVLPVSLYEWFCAQFGAAHVVDAQKLYYRIKYEKSDAEMACIAQASSMCDVMLEGMLAVLRPGILETQVAAWGNLIAQELGAEGQGFRVMVTSGEANRTLIGRALNRPVQPGDMVHLGVAPQVDGLTACERVSAVALPPGEQLSAEQRYWFDFVAGAYQVGLDAYCRVAAANLPARLQEQALVDYFTARSPEVSARLGKTVDLAQLKPYTGTHNAGYTECQEFYGAITLNSNEPLGRQIVTMLDVA
ncbi:MAG: M24 family metallopeptidase, partial [Chloroflexi bacterium]|nr:M24 family metallopeptidase [Chloroflexota bacterium]